MRVTPELTAKAYSKMKELFTAKGKVIWEPELIRFMATLGEECWHTLFPWAIDLRKPGGGEEDFSLDGVMKDVKTRHASGVMMPSYEVSVPAYIDDRTEGDFEFIGLEKHGTNLFRTFVYLGSYPKAAFFKAATYVPPGEKYGGGGVSKEGVYTLACGQLRRKCA